MDEPARKRRKTSSPGPSSPARQPERRPSFASPTKASLARNYPDILPPSRSPVRDQLRARGKQARAFILGEADVQKELSQEARDRDEDVQDATPPRQNGTGTRRLDEGGADLPLTPSQRGIEAQDGPRRGILFSSPSKKPPRVKDPVKRSPLQPKTTAVAQPPTAKPVEGENDDTQDAAEKKKHPLDPEVERKKQEKARLEHEVAELEAQVSRCAKEIAKEQQRGADDTLSPSERAEMIEFISKITGVDASKDQPVPISSLLNSFLPFSSLAIPQPQRKPQEKPAPSHRPIELADPLPYLSMFTSFNISTQLSLPRPKISLSSTRVHQTHTIDLTGPQKLLTAQIIITIDTTTNTVISMAIPRLSPWADRELTPFLTTKARENDLSTACWALESFWTLARKRAQYWHKCHTAFAHLITGHTSTADAANPTAPKQTIARRDLTRHLGRDVLVLQDSDVLLKISWRIGFDWTGEAESSVSVEHAVPRVWMEADSGESFSKIPEVFDALVESRGVFEATRILVAMLFAQT